MAKPLGLRGGSNCGHIPRRRNDRSSGIWLVLPLAAAIILAFPVLAQQTDVAPSPQAAHQADAAVAPDPAEDAIESMFPHFKDTRFWLSGQANFIFQTHPDFHAPYSGKNSLSPNYEKATSRVVTLYAGVRLNPY